MSKLWTFLKSENQCSLRLLTFLQLVEENIGRFDKEFLIIIGLYLAFTRIEIILWGKGVGVIIPSQIRGHTPGKQCLYFIYVSFPIDRLGSRLAILVKRILLGSIPLYVELIM